MFWLYFTSKTEIVLLQEVLEAPQAVHALVRVCEHLFVFKQTKTIIHNVWRHSQ